MDSHLLQMIITQVVFWMCSIIFGRLFTYRRDGARYKRLMSCLAAVVMGCAGATMIFVITGELVLPAAAWPLVLLLGVFAWAVMRSGGNMAGVMRPESGPSWSGLERRKVGR